MNPVTASNSVVPSNQVALDRVKSLRRDLAITRLVLPLIELTMGWLIDEYALEEDEAFNTQHFWSTINLENFPYLTILDKRAWAKIPLDNLGMSFEETFELDKQELVRDVRKIRPLVEDDAGITLLTLPKGLSFNKLVTAPGFFDGQYGCLFTYAEEFMDAWGSEENDKTHRILLTNNVLKGSQNKSFEVQQALLAALGIKATAPRVLEISCLLIFTLVNTNKHLLTNGTTRCGELLEDVQVSVGHNSEDTGFEITNKEDTDFYGVVCSWFPVKAKAQVIK